MAYVSFEVRACVETGGNVRSFQHAADAYETALQTMEAGQAFEFFWSVYATDSDGLQTALSDCVTESAACEIVTNLSAGRAL